MSKGPTIPDHPQLDLDQPSTKEEEVEALEEYLAKLEDVNETLHERLVSAEGARQELVDRVDRLERENGSLKSAPVYVATVEDVFDAELIVRQHGSNQEVLTDCPDQFQDDIQAGDRVAVTDSFDLKTKLETEMDARARAMEVERDPSVTYEDIGGLADQIREVREAVELPLTEPAQFDEVGIDAPAGVLLHGPPGTGKTMLAKAVANQTDATFIKMAGSELVQKFIGEGARLVRDLFELAAECEPAVVFIDEIDAIASKRTESKTAGDAEVKRTMMQLLSEMDGFDDRGEIRLIGATNRFDMLDRAILRPGRFDRLIEVPLPDVEARERIFEIHTRDMNIAAGVDYRELAEETDGASGADIKAICTEAGMFAIRAERRVIELADFRQAHEKIQDGDGVSQPITQYVR